jgi:uncharacterized OB-fold protein
MAKDRNFHADFDRRVDAPYWHGLRRGELVVERCTGCRTWIWPAEWRCGECGSFELGWESVEPTGTVYSWTRTHYPFDPSHADLIPYVHVLVALTEAGGRRLLGILTGDQTGLRIGATVRGYVEPPSARTLDLPALRWELT